MTSKPINTAVIGVGLAGTVFHLPLLVALPDLFNITVVVERNPQEEGGKARKFGIKPRIVPTIEEALGDPAVEFVRWAFLRSYSHL
jgi:predicted dehydrogenase